MSFLRIVPKHVINPKKVNYCLDCSNIYGLNCPKCYSCNSNLESLNYMSYVANVLNVPTIDVCPYCNSVEITKSKEEIDFSNWSTSYKCENCVKNFKKPKSVNRLEWVKTNCPELCY